MNSLNAKINVIEGDSFTYANHGFNGNNISSKITSVKNTNQNPFIFGVSKFGDGSCLYNSVDYFISSDLSSSTINSSGYYNYNQSRNMWLEITSQNKINSLTFIFDNLKDIHPYQIRFSDNYLNEIKTITVNSSTLTIEEPFGDKIPTYYRIVFIGLNKPNSPFVFKGVYSGETIEINSRNIISISRNSSDRADFKLPSFGIISNTSEIEFNDTNGKILQYAKDLLLKEGLECNIYLKNSLYDSFENDGKLIGVFTTANWGYNNNNRKVSVSLKDDLEEWQDINIEGFSYDAKNRPQYTLEWFYDYLYDRTPTKYKMLTFEELETTTQGILSNCTIKYPMLKSGSLWQQWTKMCQVAQAHIYKLNNGKTTFVYRGGN